ncbi:hypothetical protein AB0I81_48650 [Nonomuraea sp. NPDC050404]|uniref:hypothetical protein n=1 Tax=Nonomuraea sp. NPDC050404 TaxID=3155783 RepID=UPI0033C224B0
MRSRVASAAVTSGREGGVQEAPGTEWAIDLVNGPLARHGQQRGDRVRSRCPHAPRPGGQAGGEAVQEGSQAVGEAVGRR